MKAIRYNTAAKKRKVTQGKKTMLYMRVKHVKPNEWEFTAPFKSTKSTKTIATITRRSGQCTVVTHRPLTQTELSAMWAFVDMEQSEAA